MRDPDRIPPAVEALSSAWEAHPDWRLGQLVYNAAATARSAKGETLPPCPGLFYLEDEDLIGGPPSE